MKEISRRPACLGAVLRGAICQFYGQHHQARVAPLVPASVHPLLNFASPEIGVAQFAGTPCGLEGNAAAVQMLADALLAKGGKSFDVASELKPLYHAAAVFSSNFTVVL